MINGLSDRLRELRTNHNYSQKKIAAVLNVSPPLISSYESGERMPSIENLKALAQFYHCSADYLLGLTAAAPHTVLDISHLNTEQIAALHTLIDSIENNSSDDSP